VQAPACPQLMRKSFGSRAASSSALVRRHEAGQLSGKMLLGTQASGWTR
jgi:hypothetical protein